MTKGMNPINLNGAKEGGDEWQSPLIEGHRKCLKKVNDLVVIPNRMRLSRKKVGLGSRLIPIGE